MHLAKSVNPMGRGRAGGWSDALNFALKGDIDPPHIVSAALEVHINRNLHISLLKECWNDSTVVKIMGDLLKYLFV